MKISTCEWCKKEFKGKIYNGKTRRFCGRGCQLKSVNTARLIASTSHGLSNTRFYKTFSSMRQRCKEASKHPSWKRYGGRGIRCDWPDFESFKRDMYESYQKHVKQHGVSNTTIERNDSDGNYCRKNCRWATPKEQGRNTSRNVFWTYKGETRSIAAWSELLGWPRNILYGRLAYGWSVERSLSTPTIKRHRNKKPQ